MDQGPVDLYYTGRDEHYLRQLREEADFWDRPPVTLADLEPAPEVRAYYNERFTGDREIQWHELIPKYGEFRRGCVLGCGSEKAERQILAGNPSLHLTFYDISSESLAGRQRQFESEFPGRVATQQEDLSFCTLPENAYDLIVSQSSMHHIVNLEHLGFQINKSLTDEGRFLLCDFVAESRFQFSDAKKCLYEAVANATEPSRTGAHEFDWPDLATWDYSPFEAVRSGETLDIFRDYLNEVELRVAGAIVTLPLFARLRVEEPSEDAPVPVGRLRSRLQKLLPLLVPRKLRPPLRRLRALLREAETPKPVFAEPGWTVATALDDSGRSILNLLIIIDRIVSETGYLKPAQAFAVYRKKSG